MRRGLVRWFVLAWVCGSGALAGTQTSRPEVVPRIAAIDLAGDWYEAATSGSFALRRCLSDTRHSLVRRSERTFEVRTACVTKRGVERRRGFLEGGKGGDGRLSMRYAPLVLSWAPAAWSDFWVLDVGEGWMVVGDRGRGFLTGWSRTVALDESSLAQAIASARGQGSSRACCGACVHEVPRKQVARYVAERMAAGYAVDPKVYAGIYFLERDARGEPFADG